MKIYQQIVDLLTKEFEPEYLEVIDESHKHAGHSGARPEGETHFRVRITAKSLSNLSRIDRHRAINAVLAELLATSIHALAIEAG